MKKLMGIFCLSLLAAACQAQAPSSITPTLNTSYTTHPLNAGAPGLSFPILIDYDSTGAHEAHAANYNYRRYYFQLNSNATVDSLHNYQMPYAGVQNYWIVNANNQLSYPFGTIPITIDSILIPCLYSRHTTNSSKIDTLVINIYNSTSGLTTTTCCGSYGPITNTILHSDTVLINNSYTGSQNVSFMVRPNYSVPLGTKFSVLAYYYGDVLDTMYLSMGGGEHCHHPNCPGSYESVDYVETVFSMVFWGLYQGTYHHSFTDIGGTTGMYFDCNNNSAYDPSLCENMPHNLALPVYATITPGLTDTILTDRYSNVCPNSTIHLKSVATGGIAPYTYHWTGGGTILNPFDSVTDVIAPYIWFYDTVTVVDARGDTLRKSIQIQPDYGITVNLGHDTTLPCNEIGYRILATAGGRTNQYTNYIWTAPDGTGSSGPWPNFGYTGPGEYYVVAINDFGCTATDSINFSVRSLAAAGFDSHSLNFAHHDTITYTPCAYVADTFINSSTHTAGWTSNWTATGSAASNDTNLVHIYNTAGIDTITLTMDSANCAVSISKIITVQPASNADCIGLGIPLGVTVADGSPTICRGQHVTLTASGIGGSGNYSFNWSVSGTTGTIYGNDLYESPIAPTTYTVTVNDGYNTDSTTISVNVQQNCTGGTSCYADSSFTSPGLYPASSAIPCIPYGGSYSAFLTFISFDTILYHGTTIHVDSISIDTVFNLPCGIQWSTNYYPPRAFRPYERACIGLSGSTHEYITAQFKLDFAIGVHYNGTGLIHMRLSDLGIRKDVRLATSINCQAVDTTIIGDTSSCTSGNVIPPLYVNLSGRDTFCVSSYSNFVATVSGGFTPYIYQWSTGATTSSIHISTPGNYGLTVTDNRGATDIKNFTVTESSCLFVYINGSRYHCPGSTELLTANTYYGFPPLTYHWSNGDTTDSIYINVAGSYSVTVTDSSGVTAYGFLTITDSIVPAQSIIGNPSIVPFQTYAYLVNSFAGISYNWSVQGGAIQSGQGTNSINVVWSATGPYLVTLVRTNQGGCTDTLSLAASNSGCSLTINVTPSGPSLPCTGDTVRLTANAGSSATYQWLRNGLSMPGHISDTLLVTSTGTYQVQATSAGCTALSNGYNYTFNTPPPAPVIINNASGTCQSSNATLQPAGSYAGYLWSNGSTNSSINITASGTYTLTVTDRNGCSAISQPTTVNLSFVIPYQICLVSVDTLTNKNIIVWDKPSINGVDSFFVYKEGTQLNGFNKIGGIGAHDFSTYTDVSSNPQQQADRYQIAVLDTCGVVTQSSSAHKTIHLSINQGLGGVWNLQWNDYEGFTFPSYNIYRGTTTSALQLLTTIASGNISYTDINPPANVSAYQVEVVNPTGCSPSARAIGYSSSRSNIAATPTGISLLSIDNSVTVFPNPNNGHFIVTVDQSAKQLGIELLNIQGQHIYVEQLKDITSLNREFNFGDLAKGVYLLKVSTENGVVVKRVVVQ